MKHTPESTTHWACTIRFIKYGDRAECCECTPHEKCEGTEHQKYNKVTITEDVSVKKLTEFIRQEERSRILAALKVEWPHNRDHYDSMVEVNNKCWQVVEKILTE